VPLKKGVVVFLILQTLREHGTLTQKQIIHITNLAERTVRYYLKEFVSRGIIVEFMNLRDLRIRKYALNRENA